MKNLACVVLLLAACHPLAKAQSAIASWKSFVNEASSSLGFASKVSVALGSGQVPPAVAGGYVVDVRDFANVLIY